MNSIFREAFVSNFIRERKEFRLNLKSTDNKSVITTLIHMLAQKLRLPLVDGLVIYNLESVTSLHSSQKTYVNIKYLVHKLNK